MTKEHYIKILAKGHSAHSLHLMSGYSALYCQRILNGIRKIGEKRFWALVDILDARDFGDKRIGESPERAEWQIKNSTEPLFVGYNP